jgi:hypothetical protein
MVKVHAKSGIALSPLRKGLGCEEENAKPARNKIAVLHVLNLSLQMS